jgi:hypothetical protein
VLGSLPPAKRPPCRATASAILRAALPRPRGITPAGLLCAGHRHIARDPAAAGTA